MGPKVSSVALGVGLLPPSAAGLSLVKGETPLPLVGALMNSTASVAEIASVVLTLVDRNWHSVWATPGKASSLCVAPSGSEQKNTGTGPALLEPSHMLQWTGNLATTVTGMWSCFRTGLLLSRPSPHGRV